MVRSSSRLVLTEIEGCYCCSYTLQVVAPVSVMSIAFLGFLFGSPGSERRATLPVTGRHGGTGGGHTLAVCRHVRCRFVNYESFETLVPSGRVPVHDYSLVSPGQQACCWGIQGLLSLEDLDALTATDILRVTFRMQVRDE